MERKNVYIQKDNQEKLKEVEKNEKSFSGWLNRLLRRYKGGK